MVILVFLVNLVNLVNLAILVNLVIQVNLVQYINIPKYDEWGGWWGFGISVFFLKSLLYHV